MIWAPSVWGGLRFELEVGVPLKLQNPYPSLRVILAKEVPIFKDFARKIRPFWAYFSKISRFSGFRMAKTSKIAKFCAHSEKLTHV